MNDDRLIYANALMKNIGKIPQLRGITYGRMKKAVEETPTIDAVEVVHGRWVYGVTLNHEWRKCSECLVSQEIFGCFTYCPNCGAKMDLKEAQNEENPDPVCTEV